MRLEINDEYHAISLFVFMLIALNLVVFENHTVLSKNVFMVMKYNWPINIYVKVVEKFF